MIPPPIPHTQPGPPPSNGAQPIALLSLFTGIGTDRFAMHELLGRAPDLCLVSAASVESDPALAQATEDTWRRTACEVGLDFLAKDVWDLVQDDGRRLKAFCAGLPIGTIVLVVAGSPCQDLTYAGVADGPGRRIRAGLCGRASSAFWAVPLICHRLAAFRPDLRVEVVVENAGSMEASQKTLVCRALNIPPAQAAHIDTDVWSHYRRLRWFFSSLDPPGRRAPLARRPPPWDPGWARPLGATAAMAPMMRSNPRAPDVAVPSAFQATPDGLLCHRDSDASSLTVAELRKYVRVRLPETLRSAWDWLSSSKISGSNVGIDDLAIWLVRSGPDIGVRPPNARERSRALGIEEYAAALELPDVVLYDATGNAFDGEAFLARVEGPLRRLGNGPRANPERWLPPREVFQLWHDARRERTAAGADPAFLPEPEALCGPQANLHAAQAAAPAN